MSGGLKSQCIEIFMIQSD